MCWTVDPCGKQGEACIFTLLGMRFAWQASGMVAIGCGANVDARGRCGESCTERAFRVAGVGNRELLDFTSTCLPGRNRGRRRECADLWMKTRGGRFAIRNGSLTKRARSMAVCACRNAVGSCEQ